MSLSKVSGVIAGLTLMALTALSFTPVFADSPGQLESGGLAYEVRNKTAGGSYANTISATACDELVYSVMLHNDAYGPLSDVQVKVNLPSGSSTSNTSTMTATTNLGGVSGATGSATVNISSAQTIGYLNGTTTLYDGNGNVIRTLPDTITTSGVDVGGINGSTYEYVNFHAKVSCPSTPPPTTTYTATATASASATATASANAVCGKGSVVSEGSASATATATATASASATSTVSQADADQKAQEAAHNKAVSNAQTSAQADAKAKASAAASAKCTPAETKPVVTTVVKSSTPPSLPNTGAGDVVGLFAGSSALGTVGHFFVSRRRR